ncbi:HEL223Cp [Eremothecium sinecaudum]|uniref:HEL223Cp n=1 Tax=Eremothecium sinecaudum TaxID=45286 RepID=A0A109UZ73_9SACH|nr:HEL223Cp [Eremothecium sinecaudum]AMD21058.1 HEL223Cp [Eremothecium sinecaudum]
MSAPTMSSTAVLTELLEFPPVSLVDDLINTVNEVMYRCTEAMERYLQQRSRIGGRDYTDEIKLGTAKLETLLENVVDKNLDRLELYVLRNVVSIPAQLLEDGTFVLKHYEGLELNECNDELVGKKYAAVEEAFALHSLLRARLRETSKAFANVKKFKELVLQLLEGGGSDDEMQVLAKSLEPVGDTLKLLATQLRTLYLENEEFCNSKNISALLDKYSECCESGASRPGYIAHRTKEVVDTLFGNEEESDTEQAVSVEDNKSATSPSSCSEELLSHPDWSSIQKHT